MIISYNISRIFVIADINQIDIIKMKSLRLKVLCIIMLLLKSTAICAQDYNFLAGTYEVRFEPVQSQGIKSGCTLVFSAIVLDQVYSQGDPITISGNIGYHISDKHDNVMLGLKLGIADALMSNPKVEPPFFSYIQTAHGSTSHSKSVSHLSDTSGFKLFYYQLDEQSFPILADLIDKKEVTIGFNRRKDGMDVLVPIDLTVIGISNNAGEMQRKKSSKAVDQFTSCFRELLPK